MRCPFCGNGDTQVKDSRPTEDSAAIRRRRVCPQCGQRFTTFERVQLRELTVLKRSGRRTPFDRDKLLRSVQVALRKRPVDPERIDRMVSGIVRRLESQGDEEVNSEIIGELVMEGLKQLDDVAYVRFASVYRNFRDPKDFEDVLGELGRRRATQRHGMNAPQFSNAVVPGTLQDIDARFMAAALSYGRRHLGQTAPNPSVATIVVNTSGDQPVVISRGVTAKGGRPHAETQALKIAGEAAKGSTIYVTLEPCAHQSKTPPCAAALVAAKPARVVMTIEDPNPLTRSKGVQMLREAGIEAVIGVGADEATVDHAGHIRRVSDGRPHIISEARGVRGRQNRT